LYFVLSQKESLLRSGEQRHCIILHIPTKEEKMKNSRKRFLALSLFALASFIAPAAALAHCDTLDGPVVAAARTALARADITPVLKWAHPDKEKDLRAAFQKTITVRAASPEAKELADSYFFETLVRTHREGEGAPYTGLKPGVAVDPAVALADKALKGGSVDTLVEVLTKAMANGIRERFADTREKQKSADDSVAAGRDFVEAYVIFTHYVEGLHGQIKGAAAHHGEANTTAGGGHAH
jgi:hypothetical protein